jgi:hypothetical protein
VSVCAVCVLCVVCMLHVPFVRTCLMHANLKKLQIVQVFHVLNQFAATNDRHLTVSPDVSWWLTILLSLQVSNRKSISPVWPQNAPCVSTREMVCV